MRTRMVASACATFGAGIVLATAIMPVDATAQEYTNRREVTQDESLRRDFTVQGEYLTTLGKSDTSEGVKLGLHIIARGEGNFSVVGYLGGLPGDGWKPGTLRTLGKAKIDGDNNITFDVGEARGKNPAGEEIKMHEPFQSTGKVVIDRPQGGAPGAGGGGGGFRGAPVKLEFPARENGPAMTFEKVYRQSPTLNAKAPEDAVVVFDGTNVEMFEPGAKMNESPRGNTPRGNTLWAEATTKPFESKPYTMHLEFMLSYMPQATGQARSNSGVYIGQMYECQVLDSFGLEGENNECGGFYQIAKPLVNMCAPPLTWQTYDIDYTPPKFDGDKKTTNARVTVKHNGIVIHDNIELANATPGRLAEGPGPRGLYFQGHGNKVQYRNIWVKYIDGDAKQPQPAVNEVVSDETDATDAAPRLRGGASSQSPPLLNRIRTRIGGTR